MSISSMPCMGYIGVNNLFVVFFYTIIGSKDTYRPTQIEDEKAGEST